MTSLSDKISDLMLNNQWSGVVSLARTELKRYTFGRKMRFIIITIAFFILSGCNPVSRDEVARIKSPDGKLEAILIETNGGATTSFGYEVYVNPSDKKQINSDPVGSFNGAVRNNSAYGVNLKWNSSRELNIQYLTARHIQAMKEVNVEGEKVTLVIQNGVNDPDAPAGGMQYNLDKNKPDNQIK